MTKKISFVLISAFSLFFSEMISAQYNGGTQISLGSSYYSSLNFDNTAAWNKVFSTSRSLENNYQTGSPFINNDWKIADIITFDNKSTIANIPVRLDAKANLIEINHENMVKVLHSANTYSVAFKAGNEVFITNRTLGIDTPEGFFKIIYNEKTSLLCHYSTKIIESSYNQVLDAGIREDKLMLEQTYYILKDGKLVKLEKKRKKLIRQFMDRPEVVQYIKENHLIPREEADLLKLISYIDSIS